MLMLLRQLLAIAILPCTAAVLVPLWLARQRPPPAWPATPLEMVSAGVLVAAAGLGCSDGACGCSGAAAERSRPGIRRDSSSPPVPTATSAIR